MGDSGETGAERDTAGADDDDHDGARGAGCAWRSEATRAAGRAEEVRTWPHGRVARYAKARCDETAIRTDEERIAGHRVCVGLPHGSSDGKTGSEMGLGGLQRCACHSCRSKGGVYYTQLDSRSTRQSSS